MIGQCQKSGTGYEVRAKDAHIMDVMPLGQARGVGKPAFSNGRVKLQHVFSKTTRRLEKESSQKWLKKGKTLPADSLDQVIKIDLRERFKRIQFISLQ